jgi:hypothetical protein
VLKIVPRKKGKQYSREISLKYIRRGRRGGGGAQRGGAQGGRRGKGLNLPWFI